MLERLARDWPVYIMGGGLFLFIIYIIINSHREQKIEKEIKDRMKKEAEK